jgi:hypothetical protein
MSARENRRLPERKWLYNSNRFLANQLRRELSHASPTGRRSRSNSIQHESRNSPSGLSPPSHCRNMNRQRVRPRRSEAYISLSDSDSDHGGKPRMMVRKPGVNATSLDGEEDSVYTIARPREVTPPEDDEFQLSDEEFPELIQAARERERLKAQQRLEAQSAKEMGDAFDDIFDTRTGEADPVVEILITSKIEGTTPIMVKRKLSQRLREAKFAWCDKQTYHDQTAEEFRKSIFLTWKNHKLHETTTCRTLGVKVGDDSKLSYNIDGADVDGRIHLLAWTESAYATYQEREAEKERKEQARKDGEEGQKRPEIPKTRLILKGKGIPDFKLVVRSTTTVAKMIKAFSNSREVPEGKVVSLHLDGDKLDSESIVEGLELEDLDIIEVHIQ